MAYNEIYIGSVDTPIIHFTGEDLVSINGSTAVDLIGEELSIDTLTASIQFEVIFPQVFKPTDYDRIRVRPYDEEGYLYRFCTYGTPDIAALPYATPVYYFSDYRQIGKFYIASIHRTSRDRYVLNCESFIGLLDKKPFYGGLYSGETFENVVRQIYATDALSDYSAYNLLMLEGNDCIFGSDYNKSLPMDSEIEIKFTFRGFSENVGTALSAELGIFGCKDSLDPMSHNYALTVQASRTSASDEFDYRLFLYYGTGSSIGPSISVGSTYTVEIDTSWGYMIVDGMPYLIHAAGVTEGAQTGLYIGATMTEDSEFESMKSTIYYCRIRSQESEDYWLDLSIPTSRISTGKCGLFDTVQNVFWQTHSLSAGTPASVDGAKTISRPGFTTLDEQTQELLDSISYDDGVKEYAVYGWIPAGTKRDALQQLLFAASVNLIKDEHGQTVFTWLNYSGEAAEIEDGRNYLGGSWDYSEKANQVDLTEHTFYFDSEAREAVLFDNSDALPASGLLVIFSQSPVNVSTLTTTGTLEVHISNPNCAIVSGQGTLSGVSYQHVRNIISKSSDAGVPGKTVSATDATLVSAKNSDTILNRLFEYFTKKESFTKPIVHNGERCGAKYRLKNPFFEISEGLLTRMNFTASGIVKADCEFVTNFAPPGAAGEYEHSILLTGNGTFAVPEGVTEIKVVLIGGGSGGDSGYAGENGQIWSQATSPAYWTQKKGGAVGNAGAGGKIATFVIEDPASSYSYNCGTGGSGGEECTSHSSNNAGEDGQNTIFGQNTSRYGERILSGYLDYVTGRYYGATPSSQKGYAVAGQDGMIGDSFYNSYALPSPKTVFDDAAKKRDMWKGISKPDSTYTFSPGLSPSQLAQRFRIGTQIRILNGGWPGGAAAGENGGTGTSPQQMSWEERGIICGDGGDGGDALTRGIDALEADPQHFGWGGYGGNGGGAGGNTSFPDGMSIYGNGRPGSGGKGSAGGKGGNGCIIVYWGG